MTVYGIYSSLNSPEFEPIEREMGPILASLSSKIYQNKKLFKRIETLYNLPIKEVDQRATAVNLVELYQFCQGRSNLNPEAKEKVAKINGELASYFLRSVRIYSKKTNTWL
jgi:peptidyl-dipeptidase Dcp